MADQPHLNGAYYGPSIPPPAKTYHRPGRGRVCNPCSCCCSCLCSCLFNCIFQIILTLIIILGIIALVLWLIFRPNKVKFYATDASLTQFDFSATNNTLYYNLNLTIDIRNPNQRIGVYYDTLEAAAIYQGQRFGSTMLPTFYQGHKNTSTIYPVFEGQNLVMLQSDGLSNYYSERTSGIYSIDVKLYLRLRLKFLIFRSPKVKAKIECDLQVPLESNGRSSGSFEFTKCHLDW